MTNLFCGVAYTQRARKCQNYSRTLTIIFKLRVRLSLLDVEGLLRTTLSNFVCGFSNRAERCDKEVKWRRKNHYELRNYTTQESFYSLMRIFGWLILDEISDDLESAELVFLLSLDLQSRLRFRRIIMINNSLRFLLPRKLNFTILDFSLKRNYYEKGFTTLNGVIDKVYHIN